MEAVRLALPAEVARSGILRKALIIPPAVATERNCSDQTEQWIGEAAAHRGRLCVGQVIERSVPPKPTNCSIDVWARLDQALRAIGVATAGRMKREQL